MERSLCHPFCHFKPCRLKSKSGGECFHVSANKKDWLRCLCQVGESKGNDGYAERRCAVCILNLFWDDEAVAEKSSKSLAFLQSEQSSGANLSNKSTPNEILSSMRIELQPDDSMRPQLLRHLKTERRTIAIRSKTGQSGHQMPKKDLPTMGREI